MSPDLDSFEKCTDNVASTSGERKRATPNDGGSDALKTNPWRNINEMKSKVDPDSSNNKLSFSSSISSNSAQQLSESKESVAVGDVANKNADVKPNHSYIGLIACAVLASPEKRLVLSDIYNFILKNFSYFRNKGQGWRNSIRHNLSLNECFIKAGRSPNGKGHYWAIHPNNYDDFVKGDFRRRRAQRRTKNMICMSNYDSLAPSRQANWYRPHIDTRTRCICHACPKSSSLFTHYDPSMYSYTTTPRNLEKCKTSVETTFFKQKKQRFDIDSLLLDDAITRRDTPVEKTRSSCCSVCDQNSCVPERPYSYVSDEIELEKSKFYGCSSRSSLDSHLSTCSAPSCYWCVRADRFNHVESSGSYVHKNYRYNTLYDDK